MKQKLLRYTLAVAILGFVVACRVYWDLTALGGVLLFCLAIAAAFQLAHQRDRRDHYDKLDQHPQLQSQIHAILRANDEPSLRVALDDYRAKYEQFFEGDSRPILRANRGVKRESSMLELARNVEESVSSYEEHSNGIRTRHGPDTQRVHRQSLYNISRQEWIEPTNSDVALIKEFAQDAWSPRPFDEAMSAFESGVATRYMIADPKALRLLLLGLIASAIMLTPVSCRMGRVFIVDLDKDQHLPKGIRVYFEKRLSDEYPLGR